MFKNTLTKSESKFSAIRQKATVAINSFNRKEFATFIALVILSVVSGLWLLGILNNYLSSDVPVYGGTLNQGVVGAPRFVNPVLAASDADKDATALVFSGLMRESKNGSFVTDIAENYSISPDGKTYTFTIKKSAIFHDGIPVTADDVFFTIEQIQNPLLDSPKRPNWQGVSVEKVDDKTVRFNLKQPFSPFLSLTTVGILPAHLWEKLSPEEFSFSELNANAIGSGPYRVISVKRSASGIPNQFVFRAFTKYLKGRPFIRTIILHSYANEKELVSALKNNEIDEATGLSPENANILKDTDFVIESAPLPRIFALFMNQVKNPIFADQAVVNAVKQGIQKNTLIRKVMFGYGEEIDGPVPIVFLAEKDTPKTSLAPIDDIITSLDKAGWKIGVNGTREKTTVLDPKTKDTSVQTLSFSIATADTPELIQAVDEIKDNLKALGFDVSVKIYGLGDLNQNVIRPRDYDALFFGEYITSVGSLYAFWHSEEVADPGLNVALFKDATVDKIISDILNGTPENFDQTLFQKLKDTINQKSNVAFIYSPMYITAHNSDVPNHLSGSIISGSSRFQNVHEWYLETEKVWKIFSNK